MKDDKLKQQFDGYFEGINTPENITADAKKYVAKKQSALPKFVKYASVAASFLLVFIAAMTFIFRDDFKNNSASSPNDAANSPSSPGSPEITYYDDSSLTTQPADVYSVAEIDGSLKFIQNLAVSKNASIGECSAGYSNGRLTLVKTDVSFVSGLNRYDADVYVEYAEGNVVYSDLSDYRLGVKYVYGGVNIFLTCYTADNGEPASKLYFYYCGVKYYFDITSSDELAYEKYLKLIIK